MFSENAVKQGLPIVFKKRMALFLVILLSYPVYAAETELLKPSPEITALQESFSRLAETVKPTVVNISTIFEEEMPQYEFFSVRRSRNSSASPGPRGSRRYRRRRPRDPESSSALTV
jgi:hypothetical protein